MSEDQGGNSGDQGTGGDGGEGGSSGTTALIRPEGLGDNYWNADGNTPNFDNITKDLAGLPALQESHAANESRLAQRPESAEKYDVKLPEGFKIEGLEDAEVKLDTENPIYGKFKAMAHDLGLTQSNFEGFIGLFAEYLGGEQVNGNTADAASIKELGSNAEKRADAADNWLKAKLGETHAKALFTGTYGERVQAIEKLMTVKGMTTTPGHGSGADTSLTDGIKGAYNKLDAINAARMPGQMG